jgi:hypothetical protein
VSDIKHSDYIACHDLLKLRKKLKSIYFKQLKKIQNVFNLCCIYGLEEGLKKSNSSQEIVKLFMNKTVEKHIQEISFNFICHTNDKIIRRKSTT